MPRFRLLATICALLATSLFPAGAGEAPGWPQFRGPSRTGSAEGLSIEDGAAKLTLLWKIDIGPALSTAAVHGKRVFTGTSDETSDYLAAFDAGDGRQLWKIPLGEVFTSEFGNGPRATPTVDGERVYLMGGNGTLVAAAVADGRVVWSVDAKEVFGSELPRFGYSGSSMVIDDLLVQEVGAKEGDTLVFLDRSTGEKKYGALQGPAGYSSPQVIEIAGTRQIVTVRGRTIVGLDLEGNELWSHPVEGGVIAMPLPVGNDRLFVSAGDDTGCGLLKIGRVEDTWSVDELWHNRAMRNHFNSSVVAGGTVYGFDNATLKAVDVATGEIRWAKRGLGKGSLAVSGNVLAVLTDKGVLKIVRATAEKYEELASLQAIEGKSWTSPSIVGNRIFVRNLEQMACVEVGG
jgi:outer membrane protein assembly factor BamB